MISSFCLNFELNKKYVYCENSDESVKCYIIVEGLNNYSLNLYSISNFVFSNNMSKFFADFENLQKINFKNISTENVFNMSNMFLNCKSLNYLDLTNFNTTKVTNMNGMFKNCQSLINIKVGENWDCSKVVVYKDMFEGCYDIVGQNGTTYDSTKTDKSYAQVDGDLKGYLSNSKYSFLRSDWNKEIKEYLKRYAEFNQYDGYYFDRAIFTTSVNDIPEYVIKKFDVGSMSPYYNIEIEEENSCVSNITAYVVDGDEYDMWWLHVNVIFVYDGVLFAPENCEDLFRGFWYASDSLDKLNTSLAKNMSGMFAGCNSVNYLDLTNFNTTKVTNMTEMFYGCMSLKKIYVSDSWNIEKVNRGLDMFKNCYDLEGPYDWKYNDDDIDYIYAIIGTKTQKGYLSSK